MVQYLMTVALVQTLTAKWWYFQRYQRPGKASIENKIWDQCTVYTCTVLFYFRVALCGLEVRDLKVLARLWLDFGQISPSQRGRSNPQKCPNEPSCWQYLEALITFSHIPFYPFRFNHESKVFSLIGYCPLELKVHCGLLSYFLITLELYHKSK